MPALRYRKLPTEVDVMQLTDQNWRTVYQWMLDNDCQPEIYTDPLVGAPQALGIPTLEGVMRAKPGDWIVRGVVGEFHPVRADVFARTYEPLDPADVLLAASEREGARSRPLHTDPAGDNDGGQQ